jgi:hypothetical protein
VAGKPRADSIRVGSEVTVKVQINFAEFTWLPFASYLAGNTTLSGQYTLRRDPL